MIEDLTAPPGLVRSGVSPVYFRSGGENITGFTHPISRTAEEVVFRVTSIRAMKHLADLEMRRPGSMKKNLCWICPWPDPPCWHQVTGIEMSQSEDGMTITMKLGEHP